MKKFKLISLLTALMLMASTATGFAAVGDVTVTTDNPAMELVFLNNFDEGWGSGVTDGGYIAGDWYVNSGNYGASADSPSGGVNDKCLQIEQSGNTYIRLGYQAEETMLEAGWYRVDFDVAGEASGGATIKCAIYKNSSEITVEAPGAFDTTYNSKLAFPVLDLATANVEGQYLIDVPYKANGLRAFSLFFKATGSDYYALNLWNHLEKFYVDNIALYKVGEAADTAPTKDTMNIADMAGKEVTFTSKVKNTTAAAKNASLIHAVYDADNRLVDVAFAEYSTEGENAVGAGKSVYPKLTLDLKNVSDTTNHTVKTYLWDGMTTISPYADVAEPMGNVVVKKWDFEDGTTMGWTAAAGVTVENTSESLTGGSKALKVNIPTTTGFQVNDAYNNFYILSDEFASLYAKYGDGKYILKMNIRCVGGWKTKVDGWECGVKPYAQTMGAITPTVNVWGMNTSMSTVLGAAFAEPGNYILFNNGMNNGNSQWVSVTTGEFDLVETSTASSDYFLGDNARRFLFRLTDYSNDASTVYIDDVILEKVN